MKQNLNTSEGTVCHRKKQSTIQPDSTVKFLTVIPKRTVIVHLWEEVDDNTHRCVAHRKNAFFVHFYFCNAL